MSQNDDKAPGGCPNCAVQPCGRRPPTSWRVLATAVIVFVSRSPVTFAGARGRQEGAGSQLGGADAALTKGHAPGFPAGVYSRGGSRRHQSDDVALRCAALLPGPTKVWSCMFVSRTARRRTSLTLGTVGLAAGALTAGFITTASPASAATSTVTLTVNGVSTSVSTSADVVSELLTQQSIPFDGTDLVSPGLKADVFNGMAVSWTPAKRVLVRRAGETTAHRVVGNTVRDVRDELSLPAATSQKFARFEAHRYKVTRFYSASWQAAYGY